MSERNLRLYLLDILDSANAIFDFINSFSFEEFSNDRKTYSAVIREFEIIGEAVNKLPEEVKQIYPHIEWQDIKDFRNPQIPKIIPQIFLPHDAVACVGGSSPRWWL